MINSLLQFTRRLILVPAILLSDRASLDGPEGYHALFLCGLVSGSLLTLLAGEFLERYLFFAASAAAKMPGATTS